MKIKNEDEDDEEVAKTGFPSKVKVSETLPALLAGGASHTRVPEEELNEGGVTEGTPPNEHINKEGNAEKQSFSKAEMKTEVPPEIEPKRGEIQNSSEKSKKDPPS